MNNIVFTHAGKLGDLLYSSYFMRDYCAVNNCRADLHLYTDVYCSVQHISRLTVQGVEWITPLLKEILPFIDTITHSRQPADFSDRTVIKLDIFRDPDRSVNLSISDIKDFAYLGRDTLLYPKQWQKHFTVAKKQFDKVIWAWTPRYQNPFIDYKALQPVKDVLVFMGTDEQHKQAEELAGFHIPHQKVSTALQAAELMAGSVCVVANQSALFSIAQLINAPRALAACQYMKDSSGKLVSGSPNNHPAGGQWTILRNTQDLRSLVSYIQSSYASRNNKYAVVTLDTDNIKQYSQYTVPVNQQYADKHGYRMFYQNGSLDDTKHPVWSKLIYLHTIMQYNHDIQWLLWIDADATVVGQNKRIEDFTNTDKSLIIAKDMNGLNAGVFFIRNNVLMRNLLRDCLRSYPQFKKHRWKQQQAMVHWLETKQEYADAVLYVPIDSINRYYGTPWQGSYIFHTPAISAEERQVVFKQIYNAVIKK